MLAMVNHFKFGAGCCKAHQVTSTTGVGWDGKLYVICPWPEGCCHILHGCYQSITQLWVEAVGLASTSTQPDWPLFTTLGVLGHDAKPTNQDTGAVDLGWHGNLAVLGQ